MALGNEVANLNLARTAKAASKLGELRSSPVAHGPDDGADVLGVVVGAFDLRLVHEAEHGLVGGLGVRCEAGQGSLVGGQVFGAQVVDDEWTDALRTRELLQLEQVLLVPGGGSCGR